MVGEIKAAGGWAWGDVCDVTSPEEVALKAAAARKAAGQVRVTMLKLKYNGLILSGIISMKYDIGKLIEMKIKVSVKNGYPYFRCAYF